MIGDDDDGAAGEFQTVSQAVLRMIKWAPADARAIAVERLSARQVLPMQLRAAITQADGPVGGCAEPGEGRWPGLSAARSAQQRDVSLGQRERLEERQAHEVI